MCVPWKPGRLDVTMVGRAVEGPPEAREVCRASMPRERARRCLAGAATTLLRSANFRQCCRARAKRSKGEPLRRVAPSDERNETYIAACSELDALAGRVVRARRPLDVVAERGSGSDGCRSEESGSAHIGAVE